MAISLDGRVIEADPAAHNDASLKARMTDPRGYPGPNYDRAFAEETDRLCQQRYGNGSTMPASAPPASGGMDDASLKARMTDPRGFPGPNYDRAFAEETDRLCQQRYGNGSTTPASPSDPSNAPNEFTGDVPGDIQGYRLQASEELAPYLAGLEHDDLYKMTRAFARDAKLTDKQFDDFVRPLLEHLAQIGTAAAGDADLNARSADPRNNPASPRFDRAFAHETDRLWRAKFG